MAIDIKRILLPTDFSSYSASATKYACELATKFDAELHLLHTLEVHLASTPGFDMGLALPKQQIDLIVLATHGRSGLAHVIIGSVAESVVRTAPCPVLTVRPKDISL